MGEDLSLLFNERFKFVETDLGDQELQPCSCPVVFLTQACEDAGNRLDHRVKFLDGKEFVEQLCLVRNGAKSATDVEFETAFALAVFPENVRQDAMEDQEDTEPLSATAENGAAIVETIVARVAAHVQAMIDGENTAEVPAFH